MNKIIQNKMEVYADWIGLKKPTLVGILNATPSRGKEIFSFEYSNDWLQHTKATPLDPALHLFAGKQYAPTDQSNFGIFLDSSPDRWGRVLMDRREALLSRQENRKEKKLLESDYLLGVYDGYRIGALRFKLESRGPFLSDNKALAAPPWISLRELENASLELEKKDSEEKPEYRKWIEMLLAPGGSLGGARPKASIVDIKNNLWIAKFPSRSDTHDIGAWEMVAYQLAKLAKINMSEAKIEKSKNGHHTFLSKRFDRINNAERIHFSSAMTLLQYEDGDDASGGVSYLELAEFIIQNGANANQDLEELWRRIVFYICISNNDDHLRNHGFILQQDGWSLSPAFDINPVANANGLKLNISETDNSQDLILASEVAENFRIKPKRGNEIIQEIIHAVKSWRQVAKSLGIAPREQKEMENAFRIAER